MPEANAAWAESLRVARPLGAAANIRWARFTGTYWAYVLGDWDTALREIDLLVNDPETPPGFYMVGGSLARRAIMEFGRGETERPRADALASIELARASGDPQQIIPVLAAGTALLHWIGDEPEALAVLDELMALPTEKFLPVLGSLTPFQLVALTELGVAEAFVGRFAPYRASRWIQAARLAIAGDWAGATEIYDEMGARPDAAIGHLQAARAAVASGRRREADIHLRKATAFFRSVGATRYLAMADDLLAATA
jgi:hypothetical protein